MRAISTDTDVVRVVFRRWRDDGEILALFPDLPHDRAGLYCTCYQHIGQHGSADYRSCIERTIPAGPTAYAPLQRELEAIGYTLRIVTKR